VCKILSDLFVFGKKTKMCLPAKQRAEKNYVLVNEINSEIFSKFHNFNF